MGTKTKHMRRVEGRYILQTLNIDTFPISVMFLSSKFQFIVIFSATMTKIIELKGPFKRNSKKQLHVSKVSSFIVFNFPLFLGHLIMRATEFPRFQN